MIPALLEVTESQLKIVHKMIVWLFLHSLFLFNMIIYSWKRSKSGKVSCSEYVCNNCLYVAAVQHIEFLFQWMKVKSLGTL